MRRLSSVALGMLLSLQKLVGEQKGEMKLAGIQPNIREVFTLTRLDKVFDIYDTAEDAVVTFGSF